MEGLADTGSVLELRRGFGTGIVTALVRIEGRPMGLIANDPAHLGGVIDPADTRRLITTAFGAAPAAPEPPARRWIDTW